MKSMPSALIRMCLYLHAKRKVHVHVERGSFKLVTESSDPSKMVQFIEIPLVPTKFRVNPLRFLSSYSCNDCMKNRVTKSPGYCMVKLRIF